MKLQSGVSRLVVLPCLFFELCFAFCSLLHVVIDCLTTRVHRLSNTDVSGVRSLWFGTGCHIWANLTQYSSPGSHRHQMVRYSVPRLSGARHPAGCSLRLPVEPTDGSTLQLSQLQLPHPHPAPLRRTTVPSTSRPCNVCSREARRRPKPPRRLSSSADSRDLAGRHTRSSDGSDGHRLSPAVLLCFCASYE